jgi:suppressor of fused
VSRGSRALDAHLDHAAGGPEEKRWTPGRATNLGGAPPLDEVSGHLVGEPAHWHLVSYGFTEMESKETVDPERSGWGFELTMRVPVTEEEPEWAVDLLANLAAYLWTHGHPFAAGDHIDLRGPIRLGSDSDLTAAAIVEDPGVEPLDGPFGRVEFLQLVGLTADELEACRAWSTDGVIDLLAAHDPWLVTRIDRASLLDDPARRAELEHRAAQEGSDVGELRVGTLTVASRRRGRVVVTLGAGASAALGPALRRSLATEGAAFTVVGDRHDLRFSVEDEAGWMLDATTLNVAVPLQEVDALARLFDGRTGSGRRPELPRLRFRVVR